MSHSSNRFAPALESLDERINLSTAIPTGTVSFFVDGQSVVRDDVAIDGQIIVAQDDSVGINSYYVASANGGVWKTTDGGTS